MRTNGTRNSLMRLALLGMIALLALALGLATQVQASAIASYAAQQPKASNTGQDTSLRDSHIDSVVHADSVSWSTCNERQAAHSSELGQSALQVDKYAAELDDDDNDDVSPRVSTGNSFITNRTRVGNNPPGFVFSGTAVRYHTRR